ncbi:LPS-assembly protein LptD [Desulfobotulus mexicanus]|uniref:LPS assembly protein LptD n=1 Tax=Desulfobotulus mexicanus TaxID=2586642 RepID=A0A5Q4VIB4_9BACT|nr:LPS assembly protein LptD [Desulfobotulus mexicanus]TYT75910.1 LPS assembly protein LptD [Desulfobotulus mexicanus]
MRFYPCLLTLLALSFIGLTYDATVTEASAPYTIEADHMGYNPADGQYTATGNVRITGGDMILHADRIFYIPEEKIISGEGNILLQTGNDRMEGERIHYNMEKGTGTMEKGVLFISKSQFRLRGRKIERIGEHTYMIDGAGITTCEGDVPDWEVTASHIKVTLEGYGTLNHGAFRVRGIPVLYAPWLFFPAKTQRQSGLLMPEIHLSDRYGYEHLQPLYLAISDSSDATLYYHFMEKGRDRTGLEYRKMWNAEDRMTLRLDGLSQKLNQEEKNNPGISSDRYWFRMKQNFSPAGNARAFLDLDLLSDTAYFDDFKGGSLSFAKTDSLFQNEFGRGINPEKEKTRTNRLLLTTNTEIVRVEGEFIWEDDIRKRKENLQDSTVQRLPRIRLSTRRQVLSNTFLYHAFESEGGYFYRIDGEKGSRIDLAPRLYAPFRMGTVSAEPSTGLRQTFWYTENPMDKENEGHKNYNRTLFDARLDLFTEIYRVFDVERTSADKIRHSLQPKITFEFIPDEDQNDLPYFDDLDRIEKKRLITYSLTQSLTARFPDKEDKKDSLHGYREFLRLKISQSYDMDKAEENGEKAFSDARGEFSLFPSDNIRLFSDLTWSVENSNWGAYSAGLDLKRGINHFYAEHRYAKDLSASLHLRGYLGLTDTLGFMWEHERNLKEKTNNKQDYGLRYNAGCWQLDMIYSDDKDDKKIGFYWTLKGLGNFEHSLGKERLP